MELYEESHLEELHEENNVNNVIVEVLEFEWALKGKWAKKFIKDLAFSTD
jgi:hypothetical protein